MDLTQGPLFDDLEPVNTETDQEAECSLDEMLDQNSPEVILDPRMRRLGKGPRRLDRN